MPLMTKNKNNLLSELGKRGVYQAIGIYVAVAWGSIEILITASERFGWPVWIGDATLILFLTGLPFIVLLSWAFDLTGSGLQRMEAGSLAGKALIAGAFTLVLGLSASWFVFRDVPSARLYATPASLDGRPVIAVLPFKDFVRDEDSELLALAFTDELINRINAHPDLAALTLQSSRRAGEMAVQESGLPDVPTDFFVQGTLRPAQVGTQLQVRLVDPAGLVRWEHEQVRDFSDVHQALQAQAYMAGEIAAALGVSLTGQDYCAPSSRAEANQLYYQAREQFALRGADNVAGAALKLERAVEIDPEFARALDLLGSVYERFPNWVSQDPSQYGMSENELQEFLESQPYVPVLRNALNLCPSLGSAYVSTELAAPVRHTGADLIDLIREALHRDPGNTPLMDWAIYVYLDMGHLRMAGAIADEFLERDPFNPRAFTAQKNAYRAMGDSARSLEMEEKILELMESNEFRGVALAYDRVVLGHFDDLERDLAEEFDPVESGLPVDPRLFAKLPVESTARTELEHQFKTYVEADPRRMMELLGGGGAPPWLFELGDPELAWSYLEQFASMAPEGATIYGIWYKRWRHWFGTQALVDLLSSYTDEYTVFWDRHGPPDGCDWDGVNLDCEWAKPVSP